MRQLKKIFFKIIFSIYFLPNLLFGQTFYKQVFNDPVNFTYRELRDTNSIDFSHTIFNSTVDFALSIFFQKADFRGSQFNDTASFFLSTFRNIIDFDSAQFKEKADFVGAEFKSIVGFDGLKFNSKADFLGTKFRNIVFFSSTIFNDTANFVITQFDNLTLFDSVKFKSKADFRGAHFNFRVGFADDEFEGTVDFRGAYFNSKALCTSTFDSIADFSFAKFDTIADFSFSTFKDGAIFCNTVLPDTLIFSHVFFEGRYFLIDLTLSKTKPNSVCYINLLGSDIRKINIDYNKFRLYFDKDDSLLIEEKGAVYTSLLDKFRKDGLNQSFENLFVEYKDFKLNSGNWFTKMFNFINYWLWEFGYSKWWIFLWIILFLILITITKYIKKVF